MKQWMKWVGPALVLAGVSACASSTSPAQDPSSGQTTVKACKVAGSACRWDNQCCSGRCYVDTGCNG